MRGIRYSVQRDNQSAATPIFNEIMVGIEMASLRVSPIYYGFGIPHGDGSAVIVIPGFLGTDLYLTEFRAWLRRIGYRPYSSEIGLNAECPNLLIRRRLNETIDQAYQETSRKVHLIGHSLGGVIARAASLQRLKRIASVITLGSPFRGTVAHPSVLRVAELVRRGILRQHGKGVLPDCYTGRCTCNFLESLASRFPAWIPQTAVYTKLDGIVDWRYCCTGDPRFDCEVSATHIGLVFNPMVYEIIARRLAEPPKRRRA
jgi:pimeloyl-ACP methyl ester carboxylesterase